jgi:hypothetical protein
MKTFVGPVIASLGLLGFAGLPHAGAQGGGYPVRPGFGSYQRPTISPYLNLQRAGSSAGVNYYNLVRPDLYAYSSITQLQQQVATNQQAVTGLENAAAAPLTTGHAVGYQNHWRYFANMGRPGTTGGRPGAAGMTGPFAGNRAAFATNLGAGGAGPPQTPTGVRR